MLILPAIDLLGGRAVRLVQGDYQQVTDFGPDPTAIARLFAEAGAPWLHVVDLDGARTGAWRNLDRIAAIAAAVPVPVQAGGGARTAAAIEAALAIGVRRVVVGTAALESPEHVGQWASTYGESLAVSLDSRDGQLVTRGWVEETETPLLAAAQRLKAAGVARFVHTDVRRDGMLAGTDLSGLRILVPLGLPVIVAGGIATYDDLSRLREAGAEGAIVGRAFLEGRLEIKRAIAIGGARPVSGQ